MGPHFFKCGKLPNIQRNGAQVLRLQWGRTFSSAERGKKRMLKSRQILGLQWGRTFSSAERSDDCQNARQGRWLQWGRTFSSAERGALASTVFEVRFSFNGAALFQVRKV